MPKPEPDQRSHRELLSRERILDAALAVADAGGVSALTIRSLAQHLGVKPMGIYHYVANKRQILDGILDSVFSEIELPSTGGDWRAEMTKRARSARQVLRRHPWATVLLQTGTAPGPATLRHHNAIIGALRTAGFTITMTAHAYALLDSYIYGFALSEAALPINGPETVAEVAASMMEQQPLDDYPHLAEFSTEHILSPDYDFGLEFDFGLEVVLDGLQRLIPPGD